MGNGTENPSNLCPGTLIPGIETRIGERPGSGEKFSWMQSMSPTENSDKKFSAHLV